MQRQWDAIHPVCCNLVQKPRKLQQHFFTVRICNKKKKNEKREIQTNNYSFCIVFFLHQNAPLQKTMVHLSLFLQKSTVFWQCCDEQLSFDCFFFFVVDSDANRFSLQKTCAAAVAAALLEVAIQFFVFFCFFIIFIVNL